MSLLRKISVARWALIALVFAAPLRAAEPEVTLKAGAGRVDITPETAVLNWVTGKPYGTVLDPLSLHVLLLDDGASRVAVVRWDLVDVSESARDEVRRVVAAELSMPAENILVHASHNHSAPWSPVWSGGRRGQERDTWWALRHMPIQNEFPPFRRWMDGLLSGAVRAAHEAAAALRPVSLEVARFAANEFLFNRRPRPPAWGVAAGKRPPTIAATSPEWDAELLQGGATFGPIDRTLTLLAFRDAEGKNVATTFHLACHAVAIYPATPAISGDWPAATSRAIAAVAGGEALFFQGCAGDMNPPRRGEAIVAAMAESLSKKTAKALGVAVRLQPGPLRVGRKIVSLPLTPEAQKRIGAPAVAAEIQAIVCGPLALVALPGEPMTELGLAIRSHSPFPQTLVLGYSNGNGAHYVGMPGEKARGGYETGTPGAGTEACAQLMIDAADEVLRELFAKTGRAGSP
jgi:neutral ceramidase